MPLSARHLVAKYDLVAGYLECPVGAFEQHHVLAIDCDVGIQAPQILSHGLDYIFGPLYHTHLLVELGDVRRYTTQDLRGLVVRGRVECDDKAADVVGALELAPRQDLDRLGDGHLLGAVKGPHWLSLVTDHAPQVHLRPEPEAYAEIALRWEGEPVDKCIRLA